ncbi:sialic acid-binding Ig-like lectin 11 isoform X11 [Loxodonta africana]|uniref:sialic acid-binding Ig-like lectin 11 isoform X11 n=1 Tax=Loxodonta africana TaxID=9785 RepID=UPI000C813178|nr:sialic acid-binding Ig-like lectin 11 isoform X11 [Loxodonta africana]
MPPLLLLLLLLRLWWGIECVVGWGSQAGAGTPTHPRSPKGSRLLDDRYQLQVQNSVMVQEGLCVFIPCTFSYPPDGWIDSDPVLVYWFRQGPNKINQKRDVPVATNNPQKEVKEETKSRFQLLGDPQANNCSLQITGAQKKDGGKYIFRLERGEQKFSYKDTLLTVKVTELKYLEYLGNGSSLPALEGEYLRLLCVADSNPPATQSWVKGRHPVSPSEPWDPRVLELPRVQKEDEGEVTCGVQNRLGSQHISLRLSVLYAPQLLRLSCSREEEGLHCSCSARARPAPSLRWRVGDWLVEGNSSNASVRVTSGSAGPWANSSLRLGGRLSPGLRLHCEAQNDQGAHSVSVLLLPGLGVGLAGERERGGEFVQAAFMGAGLTTLLFLCPCLIFLIVKTRRKKATKTAAGGLDAPSVLGTITWSHRQESQPSGCPVCPPPDVATPTLGEEQELHYASLIFHGLRPREPQGQEATSTTEYSEIKIRQ